MTTRVLVVDDHPLFRGALAALVSSLDGLEVAATAGDGPEAVERAAQGDVDVVLMDLGLPTMSGVEATRRIVATGPRPPAVLVVTMVDDDATVVAALEAGALGYVLKGASGEELAAAVRTVASGGAVLGAGLARYLLVGVGPASVDDGLTAREREVLELLGQGRSNKQIARDLGLSVKTVQNYVSRVLDKLQVADRTQAALRARERDRG